MTTDPITGHESDDDMLMALADGELNPADAAALRARFAAEPSLAERFAVFAETRALLGTSAAATAEDRGAIGRLTAAVHAADGASQTKAAPRPTRTFSVIQGDGASTRTADAAQPRRAARYWGMPAMAAGLALCLGGALGYGVGLGGRDAGGPAGDVLAMANAAVVSDALQRQPSGEAVAWSAGGVAGTVTPIATHKVADGRVCREYEVTSEGAASKLVGVGCRDAGGAWRTEVAVRAATGGDSYATASGESLAERRLTDLGSAGALSEEEEQAAIKSGWTPAQP